VLHVDNADDYYPIGATKVYNIPEYPQHSSIEHKQGLLKTVCVNMHNNILSKFSPFLYQIFTLLMLNTGMLRIFRYVINLSGTNGIIIVIRPETIYILLQVLALLGDINNVKII
jgi:hypothetical protein